MKILFRLQTIIAIVIICFTMVCLNSCETNNKVDSEKVKDKISSMDKSISESTKAIANDVSNVAATATDGVSDMAEKSIDKVESTITKASDKLEEAAKAVKDKAGSVKDKATTAVKEVKAVTKEVKNTATEQVKTATSKPSATTKPAANTKPSTSQPSKPKTTPSASTKPMVKDKVQTTTKPSKPAPVGASHEAFDQLLRKHVSNTGEVNYAGLKSETAKLNTYLELLRQNPVKSNWPKNKQLVYWINAYNAFTLKLILDNYPLKKITDLENGKPWDKVWIKLGDKSYSLNNIENDIIRPQFNEPRIHFAVNCAAKSCPPLLNRAWTVANLERSFESQTKAFVNNPKYNKISASSASLSKIFDWYGEDFGDIRSFLNKYSNVKLKDKSNLDYMEYDWNLNEK